MNPKRLIRRLVLLFIDAVLVAGAFLLAYELRLNLSLRTFPEYVLQYTQLAAWVVIAHLLCFLLFDLYRGVTRFTGRREILAIASSATVVSLLMLLYNFAAVRRDVPPIPRSVIPLTWMLVIAFNGGIRYVRRLVAEGQIGSGGSNRRGVLIVGAGSRGESVARELRRNRAAGRIAVGFIDENPEMHGRLIHGIEVLGGIEKIEETLERLGASEVIVTLPNPSPRQMKAIADHCGRFHVSIQRLPSAEEIMDGQVTLERLRPVKIEDLLGRPPVRLELPEEDNYLKGRSVLVTGAGGSIGSELCRQIMRAGPNALHLLGHGENSLYEIASELGYWRGEKHIRIMLADIQNEQAIGRLFKEIRPQVVFHAAAHKHVPFGELAPAEMARNNVLGTLFTARAASEAGAQKYILISTDKAVRPVNVLGATKRVAEMVVGAMQAESETEFIAVRFGNVLGSRGSVVPLFLRQIEAGGPLTLTDPEMTRYFMTIQEAASLVLQAGAIGRAGQLMVLDMGEPVKISELARNLVTLAGLEPGRDIDIEFIGARPGEKVREELLTAQEGLSKTRNGKILVTPFAPADRTLLCGELDQLRPAVEASDSAQVREILSRLVEDYRPGS